MQVAFAGNSIRDIALQARAFADSVLGDDKDRDTGAETTDPLYGYRPVGVGRPTLFPVDDGIEWIEPILADWLQRLNSNGKQVVELLARKRLIDPRREASSYGWTPREWSGYSRGPGIQAEKLMQARGLKSWPYGHCDDEPVRLWMHPSIARRVLKLLREASDRILADEIAVLGQAGGAFAWLAEEPELYTIADGEPV